MNYVDYLDAVDILGCLLDNIESVIESLETYRFTRCAEQKEKVKKKLIDIKINVKKHLDLFLHNNRNIYTLEYLIAPLCISSYILSKIGVNRINPNSYEIVRKQLYQVQFYVKKYYNSILNHSH
ncbi:MULTISPECIES: hypothetical protein [unclassified Sutcliffiella]|uniref:hypothetical protein n=1 Tax=unclassified Sutcliffiella TaxID=2837532 RepID=UPI0030D59C0E